MSTILIVDDDIAISQLVSDALQDEGFKTVVINDSSQAIEYIKKHHSHISVIILDIMMPGISGLEICKKIRDSVFCPIIFMTAKSKTVDTVVGLEMGADDYISKPFVVEELVARVKAHIRRELRTENSSSGIIRIGAIELRTENVEVFRDGKPIPLSTKEFQLLEYLMANAGKVLSREQIFAHVWDTEVGDTGTVAVNIKSLRDKLDQNNEYIKTIWGVGYKFITAAD
ncbi:MAG: response regulator transcription factor [Clostridia bacterium]|nr:response regulator transcription factor [Clostridia bacterium]